MIRSILKSCGFDVDKGVGIFALKIKKLTYLG